MRSTTNTLERQKQVAFSPLISCPAPSSWSNGAPDPALKDLKGKVVVVAAGPSTSR